MSGSKATVRRRQSSHFPRPPDLCQGLPGDRMLGAKRTASPLQRPRPWVWACSARWHRDPALAKYAQIVGHRRSPGPVVKRVRPQGNLVAYSSDVVKRAYDNASKADEEVSAVVRRWNDITTEVVAIDPVNRAGAAARAKVLTDLEVLRTDTETSLLNAEANDRELIRFMRLELQSTPSYRSGRSPNR